MNYIRYRKTLVGCVPVWKGYLGGDRPASYDDQASYWTMETATCEQSFVLTDANPQAIRSP